MADRIDDIFARLKDTGYEIPQRIRLQVPDARKRLADGLKYVLARQGEKPQWLPEYEQVADWLADNKGKGLLLAGNCGRGKTLIAVRVLPIFFAERHLFYNPFNSYELNNRQNEVFRCKILCVDDLGVENESVKYGERRNVFTELIDSVEKKGKLLVVTTNLTQDEIMEKYGTRTLDRIFSCCKIVTFSGRSLRH